MWYINTKEYGACETVDEFETLKEARLMVQEYRGLSGMGGAYISKRATKDWRLKK